MGISQGQIGNALQSTADNSVVALATSIFDTQYVSVIDPANANKTTHANRYQSAINNDHLNRIKTLETKVSSGSIGTKSVGTTVKPIYINNGVPTACGIGWGISAGEGVYNYQFSTQQQLVDAKLLTEEDKTKTEPFLQATLKQLGKLASEGNKHVVYQGIITPNSTGYCHIEIYGNFPIDAKTRYPKYSSGAYYDLSGNIILFGSYTTTKDSVDTTTWRYSTVKALPLATSSSRGGIQIGYTSTTNNRAVQLSSSEKAYVNIPNATASVTGLMSSTNYSALQELIERTVTIGITGSKAIFSGTEVGISPTVSKLSSLTVMKYELLSKTDSASTETVIWTNNSGIAQSTPVHPTVTTQYRWKVTISEKAYYSNTCKLTVVAPIYFGFGTTASSVKEDANKHGTAVTSSRGLTLTRTNGSTTTNLYLLVPNGVIQPQTIKSGGAPVAFTKDTTSVSGYITYKLGSMYPANTKASIEIA